MIIENVDEEIPRVIIKTFGIKSCARGFYFFQNSWQPKPGEILNPVMKTNRLLSYMICN